MFHKLKPKYLQVNRDFGIISMGKAVKSFPHKELISADNQKFLGHFDEWRDAVVNIERRSPFIVIVDLSEFPQALIFPDYFTQHSIGFIGICKDSVQMVEAMENGFYQVLCLKKELSDINFLKSTIQNYYKRLLEKNRFKQKFLSPFSFHSRLVVPDEDGFKVLKIRDIGFIKAKGRSSEIHGRDHFPFDINLPLKSFEEILFRFNFRTCHKSYLVNLDNVEKYKTGQQTFLVVTGQEVPVSFRKKALLKQLIQPENLTVQKYNFPGVLRTV